MKAKRERDRQRDEEARLKAAESNDQQTETTDWQQAMKGWNDYYNKE